MGFTHAQGYAADCSGHIYVCNPSNAIAACRCTCGSELEATYRQPQEHTAIEGYIAHCANVPREENIEILLADFASTHLRAKSSKATAATATTPQDRLKPIETAIRAPQPQTYAEELEAENQNEQAQARNLKLAKKLSRNRR